MCCSALSDFWQWSQRPGERSLLYRHCLRWNSRTLLQGIWGEQMDGVTCGRESVSQSVIKHWLSSPWPGTLLSIFVLIQFAFTSWCFLYCKSQNGVPTSRGPSLTLAATQFQFSLPVSPALPSFWAAEYTQGWTTQQYWPLKRSGRLWLPVWPGLGPTCLPLGGGRCFICVFGV